MKNTTIVLLLMLVMAGCENTKPVTGEPANNGTANNPSVINPPADNDGRQKEAFLKKIDFPTINKIRLTPGEHASLTKAIQAGDTVQPPHIHASVENERLVFSADTAHDTATHLTGKEPEISLTGGGQARKIVADRATLKLLQERAAP